MNYDDLFTFRLSFSNCFHRYLFNFLAVVALFVWQLTSFTLAFTYIHTFMLTSHHFFRCFPFYGAKKHCLVYDRHTHTPSRLMRCCFVHVYNENEQIFILSSMHCIALSWFVVMSWAAQSCNAVQLQRRIYAC